MQRNQDGAMMAKDAIESYELQVSDLEKEARAIQVSFDEAKQQFEEALIRIAGFLLPSSAPDVVQRVAADLGANQLPGRIAQMQQQRVQSQARLAQIDADPRYAQRSSLLHPTSGTISRRINELKGYEAPLQQSLQRFDHPLYQDLLSRGYQHRDQDSGFQKFWKAVTLVSHKETKMWEQLQQELGHESFAACVAEHEQLMGQVQALQQEMTQLEAQKAEIFALLDERVRHDAWVNDFDKTATEALRKELVEFLRVQDWTTFYRRIRPRGRLFAAQCHALVHKATYFREMLSYLGRETADRNKRIQSIDSVRRKWIRRPHAFMSGDKSKWLRTIPAMKREGTAKRIRWIGSMHRGIHGFDDYEDYGRALGYEGFYPYDAFHVWSDERMPHEGFVREVFPNLALFRQRTGIERVDKRAYREFVRRDQSEWEGDDAWDDELDDEDEAAAALAEEEIEGEEEMEDAS